MLSLESHSFDLASSRIRMSAISVIDIGQISLQHPSPSTEDYQSLVSQVRDGLEKTGFLYIRNHGVPSEVIEEAMRTSMDFFNLDREVKNETRKGAEYQEQTCKQCLTMFGSRMLLFQLA